MADSPAPTITPDMIAQCNLPALADVQGKVVEHPNAFPEYLQPVVDQLRAALERKDQLIAVDLRTHRQARIENVVLDGGHHEATSIEEAFTPDADIYQLLNRWFSNLPGGERYELITPDDRNVPGDYESHLARSFYQRTLKPFLERVVADEEGEPLFTDGIEGAVVVYTNEMEQVLGEKMGFYKSKMSRAFRNRGVTKIDVPAVGIPTGNLYEYWTHHIQHSDIAGYQQLFEQAANNPVEDIWIKKFNSRFAEPLEEEDRPFTMLDDKQAMYRRALQLFQAQTWANINVRLHSSAFGNGKTTLMATQAQALHQLGITTHYYRPNDWGKIDNNNVNDGHRVCIDQSERVQHGGGFQRPPKEGSRYPENLAYVSTSNSEPSQSCIPVHEQGITVPESPTTFSALNKLSFAIEWPGTAYEHKELM